MYNALSALVDLVGRVQPVQDSPRPVREHLLYVVVFVNLEDGDVDVENAAVQESELNLIADLQDRACARAQGHRFELACPAGLAQKLDVEGDRFAGPDARLVRRGIACLHLK